MSEAVLAQYVVSVDLHTTYTKELFIFNYEILFKMKSEYFTLKITNSCHFICTYFCIHCLHDFFYIIIHVLQCGKPKINCNKLLLSILYGRSSYCQYNIP